MKRIRKILASAVVVFLIACGPGKVVKEAQETFKGDWILNNVTYPGSTGSFNVTLFNEANASCFTNSTWHFVENNNTGTYTIQKTGCNSGERYFRWKVEEVNEATGNYDFLFKPTNEKNDDLNENTGFRINLISLTETTMIWEQTVMFEGDDFTIRMEFNKIQK
ncbi:MAG TPA: lipocalin family protein [Salinimicrobium sp.]|nr:lipocalin family protein [Salinimicrobium sp.]